MKTFYQIYTESKEKSIEKVLKNVQDEITAYKNPEGKVEKVYLNVLLEIEETLKGMISSGTKTISWDTMRIKIQNSKSFDVYVKENTYADIADFRHLYDEV